MFSYWKRSENSIFCLNFFLNTLTIYQTLVVFHSTCSFLSQKYTKKLLFFKAKFETFDTWHYGLESSVVYVVCTCLCLGNCENGEHFIRMKWSCIVIVVVVVVVVAFETPNTASCWMSLLWQCQSAAIKWVFFFLPLGHIEKESIS